MQKSEAKAQAAPESDNDGGNTTVPNVDEKKTGPTGEPAPGKVPASNPGSDGKTWARAPGDKVSSPAVQASTEEKSNDADPNLGPNQKPTPGAPPETPKLDDSEAAPKGRPADRSPAAAA
jgi:hypothetical protein